MNTPTSRFFKLKSKIVQKNRIVFLLILLSFFTAPVFAFQNVKPENTGNRKEQSKEYLQLNEKLKKGWNTWDTKNVLS